jgi:hypothetical protein
LHDCDVWCVVLHDCGVWCMVVMCGGAVAVRVLVLCCMIVMCGDVLHDWRGFTRHLPWVVAVRFVTPKPTDFWNHEGLAPLYVRVRPR